MADTSELKHMVMSFRVSELQVLLGYAGRNKTGRKTELLQRALQLIQKGASVPIQIKIRELYKRKVPGRADGDVSAGGMTCNYNLLYPGNGSGVKAEASRYRGGPLDFSSSTRMPTEAPTLGIPVHPDVRYKILPFYDLIADLMKPTSLLPRGTSKFQETHFNFHLTPQQAQDIAMSSSTGRSSVNNSTVIATPPERDFRPGAKFEYTTQIQLRFCFLETTCEQDDNFPPSICVRVNGKMATLPNPIPTTKPGVEPKRPGRPVDITPLCRLSPTMPNQVEVSWATDFSRGYCIAIYLVKKLSSDKLLQRLKQFGSRHADHTRALIKEKLSHDHDSEIATTSLRVSLLCPLGKMRIQIPIRASTCTHLQCFDASTFLMMNEKKPTWICPVCDKPSQFHKLFIDGLFLEILRQNLETNEIQFTEDGSWSQLRTNRETHVISSPVIKGSSSSSTMVNLTGSASPQKKPKMDVIDLTISSDEEDDAPTPRPSSCFATSPGCVSPQVISLDSPTPVPSSISSADSPLVSSPCSNSSSSSSSSSSSNSSSPAGRSSPGSNAGGRRLSTPHTPVPTSSQSHSPPCTPNSAHSTTQSPQPSPKQSPIRVRMSPVTPPSTSTPSFPPFQPFPPAPVAPLNYPYPTMSNFDPSLDREIDEFLQGIVWDQYINPGKSSY